ETVLDAFRNEKVNAFINKMVESEVLPLIEGDRDELRQFADGILERFYNPYIRHMLKSIALNSLSKWETRNFPTVRDMWEKEGRLAELELFTFAALLTLYAPDSGFTPEDNAGHVDYIRNCWNNEDIRSTVSDIVNGEIFVENFEVLVPGFSDKVAQYVALIQEKGMDAALGEVLS
ncbi:MAG: altronate oxidoreductase, partial [Muribaculaceae bacterium]|nr:altronate oxidoreductase [Muribaculaceae bacterium]